VVNLSHPALISHRFELFLKDQEMRLTLKNPENLLSFVNRSHKSPTLLRMLIQNRLQFLGVKRAGKTPRFEGIDDVLFVLYHVLHRLFTGADSGRCDSYSSECTMLPNRLLREL
jgi:hypothetical protein